MSETLPQQTAPPATFEWFMGLAALAFLGMGASIFAYGLYGPQMTAGLDVACAEAAFNSGKKLEELGNYDQAIQRFRQAMEGRFQSPEQQYMCGRSIGDLLFQQNRYSEAIEAYRELPPEAFAQAGSYPGYVNALRLERRFDEAKQLAGAWIGKAEAQNDAQQLQWAHHALMRVASETGDEAEVVSHAKYLVEHDPVSDAHLVLAKTYVAQGKTDEATALLDAFLGAVNDLKLRDQAYKLKNEIETNAI